jgi:hypothetical protein
MRRAGSAFALSAALVTAAACAPATVAPATKVPATRAFTAAIESSVPYQPAAKCPVGAKLSTDKPGPVDFRNLLLATYGTNVGGLTVFNGITRPCDGTVSEHSEGRALDWGMDYRNPAMRADGQAVLNWLFATDKYGNQHAMARRLGIMYVIWNHKIYGSWNNYAPAAYSCGTDPTACHVDHIHFSFDWAGARAQTSFFTGGVAQVQGGPALR